jgi:hypothetical protein
MARKILIDDDVYEGIKKLADPFEDTPNIVIRKLLIKYGIISAKPKNAVTPRSINEQLTPQWVYEEWLLYILWHQFSGKATKVEATEETINAMNDYSLLGEADSKKVSTGEARAVNTIAWGRNRLKEKGLISAGSPRGIWELTNKGIEKAQEAKPPKKKTWSR